MEINDLRMMFEYNRWANKKVMDATAKVGHEDFLAPTQLSHKSLRGTLLHIFSGEWIWRKRLQEGISPPAMLSIEAYPNFEKLREAWEDEERTTSLYLEGLSDGDINRNVSYTTTLGVNYTNVMWQMLVQVLNHSTQFRGEAGVRLAELGHSPGDLDFIAFLREKALASS